MKIYFEDGKINLDNAPNDILPHTVVDAKKGASVCYNLMKESKGFWDNKVPVYTNSVTVLLHAAELSWNKETKRFDIYLRCKNGEWKNIHELTTRELRVGHNIWRLWWAGEFEEAQRK